MLDQEAARLAIVCAADSNSARTKRGLDALKRGASLEDILDATAEDQLHWCVGQAVYKAAAHATQQKLGLGNRLQAELHYVQGNHKRNAIDDLAVWAALDAVAPDNETWSKGYEYWTNKADIETILNALAPDQLTWLCGLHAYMAVLEMAEGSLFTARVHDLKNKLFKDRMFAPSQLPRHA